MTQPIGGSDMARTRGNLALQAPGGRGIAPRRSTVRTRRVVTPLFPAGDPRHPAARAEAVRRSVARGKWRTTVFTLLGVVALFGVFSTLLINQSRVMEAQFHNTEMELRIAGLRQDQALIKEEIMKTLDLAKIRLAAIDRLGMQEAGRNQTISVGVAVADLVVYNGDANEGAVREEAVRLETLLANLEGFYKSLR